MDWVLVFLVVVLVVVLVVIGFFYFEKNFVDMCRLAKPQLSPKVERIFSLTPRISPWMNINPSIWNLPPELKSENKDSIAPHIVRSEAEYVVAYRLHRKEGFNWYWFSKVGISFLDKKLN